MTKALVGVPKEVKTAERRVVLVPDDVKILTASGIRVLIESGAGNLSGFSDHAYQARGAEIVQTAQDIFRRADLIVKVKEPQPSEFEYIRDGSILFCFLHLASPDQQDLIRVLLKKKVTAIGFETIEDRGRLPLLAPMSEIAGGLGAYYAILMYAILSNPLSAREDAGIFQKLEMAASEFPRPQKGLKSAQALIFGGGVAGTAAYHILLKHQVDTAIVEISVDRRLQLSKMGLSAVSLKDSRFLMKDADLLIGAAHSPGKKAVTVISLEQLRDSSRDKKKILVDISIDQGGNFPEPCATTYKNAIYWDQFGNLRFAVPNIPSLAGPIASRALSKACLPYVEELVLCPEKAFAKDIFKKAINVRSGRILLPSLK